MLRLNNITKTFSSDFFTQPFTALDDVSFEIPNGAMVGFLGANGAGKTTSLKIIMDFIRADSGTVSFDRSLGSSRSEILRNIGYLPERPYFYQNLTGHEFLDYMGSLSELSHAEIKSQSAKWSERFGIDHALTRQLKTYSKGMLQRIGFLATVLHNPSFIILDEPLSGLDPVGRKELKDAIVEVHKAGKTIFFSSHIVPDVEEICGRVVFIKQGRLIYDGEVSNLIKPPEGSSIIVKFRMSNLDSLGSLKDKVEKLESQIFAIRVSEAEKNSLISKLLSVGADIHGVDMSRPSLEEIFYNLKNTNV